MSGRHAAADWSSAGAQYSCDDERKTFTLLPYVESSSNEHPELEPGFGQLPDDGKVTCALGARTLNAWIAVTGPRSHGMCMGAGSVDVRSLVVNGVELLEAPIMFDWDCSGGPVVTKIAVRPEGPLLELEQCTTQSELATESPGLVACSSKSFDVDALAAAQAATDHRIDDAATQARLSATRLPDLDLARVFASRSSAGTDVPLCAHWSATFIDAIVNPEQQWHGRVAGTAGDRVALRPKNPQLCPSSGGEGCTPSDYVSAGDRVDVGFICGQWTQIQTVRRVLSEPQHRGWVETARLYDLDPLVDATLTSGLGTTVVASTDIDATFLAAIVAGDVGEVRRLVAAGTDPNGLQKLGSPLADAVALRDIEMVRTLLDLGADVNAHGPECRVLDLALEDEPIFALLRSKGLDLECPDRYFSTTQLMRMARYSRLLGWQLTHKKKGDNKFPAVRDPVALVKRLLAAGAKIDAKDKSGQTVLFHVAQANNVDVAKLLLDLGADPSVSLGTGNSTGDSTGDQLGSTPLMNAMGWSSLTFDTTIFQLLLEAGADPNYRNKSRYDEEWDLTTSGAVTYGGQTVLTRAAQDGRIDLVRLLLEHGADPRIARQDGVSAEELAQRFKHPEVAALIASYASRTPPADEAKGNDGNR